MGNAEASPQRICRVCGHANSGLSLFCAECGSVLNGGTDAHPGTSSTVAGSPPPEPDTQQTQAFSPGMVTPGDERWAPSSSDPTATAAFPPASAPSPASASRNGWENETSAATSAALPAAAPVPGRGNPEPGNIEAYDQEEQPESLRGFFFGVAAFILILIVAALFTWTILPNGGLRDTIQGWLDALPF